MKRLCPSLVLAACFGCSLNTPNGPNLPANVLPGLSIVSSQEKFQPMGFGFDSAGDLVVAQPDQPQVNVISAENLDYIETDAVPALASDWASPLSSTGYAGALFYRAGNGSIYLFDITQHTSQLFLTPTGLKVFTARMDTPAVVWGDHAGVVHFDDQSGTETLTVPLPKGTQVESIASGGSGQTFVYGSVGGRCTSIYAYDASGRPTTSIAAALGASPCLVALTLDSQVILASAASPKGTQLQAFQGGTLAPASQALTITGMAAQKVVFSADDSRVGLMGGPNPFGTSVAVAMTSDLFTNTPRGNQGPFRTVSSSVIPTAVDGIFDDSNVLWVGDVQSQSIDLLE